MTPVIVMVPVNNRMIGCESDTAVRNDNTNPTRVNTRPIIVLFILVS